MKLMASVDSLTRSSRSMTESVKGVGESCSEAWTQYARVMSHNYGVLNENFPDSKHVPVNVA